MRSKYMIIGATLVMCLMVALFLAPAAGSENDTVTKELGKMNGTWKYIGYEQDGKRSPKPENMPSITFDGELFTIQKDGKIFQKGINTVYPGHKPRAVDAKVIEGTQKGSVLLGIYEIDGDVMRVCFGRPEKGRPKDFSIPKGSGYFLVTLKKVELPLSGISEGEKLVRKLFSDFKARRLSDVEKMISKGFQSVHQDGVRGKNEELTLLKDLNLGDYVLSNFKSTVEGDMLVVTYTIAAQETIGGKKTLTVPSQRLSVFYKDPQGWKWLAHTSFVQISGSTDKETP